MICQYANEREVPALLRDGIGTWYLERDNNCAETTLRIINERYGLGLTEEDVKLVGAFGAGYGCGITCGALSAAMAALGKMAIGERAHATPGFRELCGAYVAAFREALHDTDCAKIKETFFREDGTRCLLTVQANADLFERFVREHGLVPGEEEA